MESRGERGRLVPVVIGLAVLAAVGPLVFWLAGNLVGFLFIGAVITLVAVIAVRWDRSEEVEVAAGSADGRRVLVVVHAGADGEALSTALEEREQRATEVRIIVPALTTRTKRFTGQIDEARQDAEAGVERLVDQARAPGRAVEGAVGDADPRTAVEDALRAFGADEVLVIPPPDQELEFFRVSGPEEVFRGVPLPVTVIRDA